MSLAGLIPSESLGGRSVPGLFQFLVAAGVLGSWPHPPSPKAAASSGLALTLLLLTRLL